MPSTMTSRVSRSVSPTSAMRAFGSLMATARTHSAPARVLPAPRPPRMSHVVHGSPLFAKSGGSWWLCAKTEKSLRKRSRSPDSISASSSAVSSAICVLLSGNKRFNAPRKRFAEFVNVARCVVFGCIGRDHFVRLAHQFHFAQRLGDAEDRADPVVERTPCRYSRFPERGFDSCQFVLEHRHDAQSDRTPSCGGSRIAGGSCMMLSHREPARRPAGRPGGARTRPLLPTPFNAAAAQRVGADPHHRRNILPQCVRLFEQILAFGDALWRNLNSRRTHFLFLK